MIASHAGLWYIFKNANLKEGKALAIKERERAKVLKIGYLRGFPILMCGVIGGTRLSRVISL